MERENEALPSESSQPVRLGLYLQTPITLMKNSRTLVHVHKYSQVCLFRPVLLGSASFSRF